MSLVALSLVEVSFSQEETKVGPLAAIYEESHALIIGNSEYEAPWSILNGVKSDVVAVREVLESHGFEVQLEQDLKSDSFHVVIENFIDEYGSNEQNRLLFYYAGHGETIPRFNQNSMGFIVPVDAPLWYQDSLRFVTGAVSMEEIVQYVSERIKAKHSLFVFDSCFSGAVLGEIVRKEAIINSDLAIERGSNNDLPESILYSGSQPVRQFIVSGTENEKVPDDSIFRRKFVSVLSSNAGGVSYYPQYLTGIELGSYLEKAVSDDPKSEQHTLSRYLDLSVERGDMIFNLKSTGDLGDFEISRDQILIAGKNKIRNAFWQIRDDTLDINFDLQGLGMRKFDIEVSLVRASGGRNQVYNVEQYVEGNRKIRSGEAKRISWAYRDDIRNSEDHPLSGEEVILRLKRKENGLFYVLAGGIPVGLAAAVCTLSPICIIDKDLIADPILRPSYSH